MLKITFKIFSLLLLIFTFSLSNLFAQESTEQRRSREHQAVIDYLNTVHRQSPLNTENLNTSELKYGSINRLSKLSGVEDRKRYLMNGNNVLCELWNYGGVGPGYPGASLRELLAMVWRDLPYIFQFSPVVGAEVIDTDSNVIHIISDGLYDYPGLREIDPATEFWWTWQPLPGYADPNQEFMASNPAFDSDRDGKPDSWPRDWYNPTLGEYVWPGYLKQGENNADLEVYWAMDDRDNREFKYFPFNNDTLRKGLGVQIDGRAFQWSNSLAANALFCVWTITNLSDKDLDSVFFGIYGDPDIGGLDNDDDQGSFIPPFNVPNYPPVDNIPVYARSMVYFFDNDGIGDGGLPVYYLGCKFLESPSNSIDGIDNDGDGLTDESQENLVDDDGDWNPETDDVGVDGIAGTGDTGEGDGVPTRGQRLFDGRPDPLAPGEPNFEYTDLDEADQIGLTSFNSWTWNTDRISNDESMWNRSIPGNFGQIENDADIVFIFGSGYISLKKNETKRISMAFLFGEDLNDLLVTAETVQDIYNKNYRFFRPPDLPKVTAVPDDKKVTLYWDTKSEESIDPITGKDFEGYVIYRSTRPDFADIQTVTDGRGSRFLYEPLKDITGFDAKFDLDNEWRGYHPVPYQGRGIQYYLGDNTGLKHSFVDSNAVRNGQTYYYAVVAYDHGDSLGIPPTETTKKISVDPITSRLIFDDNTTQAIPGPRASGYNAPTISNTSVLQTNGIGNGVVDFKILNDLNITDDLYTLTFSDTLFLPDTSLIQKNYSVVGQNPYSESFFLFDTKFTSLARENIINDQFLEVKDATGRVYQNGVDYEINYQKGSIKRTDNSSMPNNSEFSITYRSYAVYQSTALKEEDSNPVFDGVKLKVFNYDQIDIDPEKTGWQGSVDIPYTIQLPVLGGGNIRKIKFPADYIMTFSNINEFIAKKPISGTVILDVPVPFKVEDVTSGIPVPVTVLLNERNTTGTNDTAWTRGDEIVFLPTGKTSAPFDSLAWAVIFSKMSSTDSTLPGAGDFFLIHTQRPFTPNDVFTLATKSGFVDNTLASSRLDNIYVVPNPYVGSNEIEPANRLPSQNRGERRIYFENLPMKCTIRIFTLSGELVQSIDHDSGMDNGREFWNLLNKDGFSVAYGVYLAHIDAPGIGEKLIKFALIK